ncbi:MAG: 3-deoxy-D-manno-octulosonic acid transferase [Acidobacteriota bacterium]
MIVFFYNVLLCLGLVITSPYWLWRVARTEKYREGMRERVGIVPARLLTPTDRRPSIWLHAVSVGEVLAISRLVSELDAAFPDHRILISTTTRTGQALARERFGAERVFYSPLDLPWATRAYLRTLRPELLVLAETEFWPNLLSGCFRRDIPVAVVNARISDRSWPRYLKLRLLWRTLLSRLSAVLAQTPADAERLRAIGCQAERVSVAGNLKFDIRAAQPAEATRLIQKLTPGLGIVVAGSTLEGEEVVLLKSWQRLIQSDPNLVLVLAPRHPERFADVASLLEASGLQWLRRSDWKRERFQPRLLKPCQVVLLDTIGELASTYSLASLAFVGGSLVPAGGHNPLEPAQFGVPLVMGPHYVNFRAICDDLLAHNAMRIATEGDLSGTMLELLRDRESAHQMGARARQVFEAQAGATARCVAAVGEILHRSPAAQAQEQRV